MLELYSSSRRTPRTFHSRRRKVSLDLASIRSRVVLLVLMLVLLVPAHQLSSGKHHLAVGSPLMAMVGSTQESLFQPVLGPEFESSFRLRYQEILMWIRSCSAKPLLFAVALDWRVES